MHELVLLKNRNVTILTLTDSWNSHTSANPDNCNTLRTYEDISILLFTRCIWLTVTVLNIQLFTFLVNRFKKHLMMRW